MRITDSKVQAGWSLAPNAEKSGGPKAPNWPVRTQKQILGDRASVLDNGNSRKITIVHAFDSDAPFLITCF
jgi:hypothetical protein